MRFFWLLIFCLFIPLVSSSLIANEIDYTRDIQPILANHCYACHGPDQATRKADLRLDLRDHAILELPSGETAIVAGNSKSSALIQRIFHSDPSEQMPPAESKKQLTDQQRQLLKAWIEQGAAYSEHWAFIAPKKPKLPTISNPNWANNEIDLFVAQQHEQRKLSASAKASRTQRIRRLSFDLRGLPPSLEEIDAFLSDDSDRAYEKLVDRMLGSIHFAEKLTQDWLDLARYGDTNGYHNDSHRDMWLYRDWLIHAFHSNMPFDQFIREQIAGDLMPDATNNQQIASAFHRNAPFNEEGGADPDEFYVAYAVDRTNTTGQALLGLTVGCAQCHSHKYDPISQTEYYELFAFFNSVDGEIGGGGENGHHGKPVPPTFKAQSPLQTFHLKQLENQIAKIDEAITAKPSEDQTKQLAQTRKSLIEKQQQIQNQQSTVMVMRAMQKPKPAYVLARGDFQQPGKLVQPNVPKIFPALPKDRSADRLALADWLVQPDHPLVARVRVNHLWKLVFGAGIVRTPGDFGTQGTRPTHPELLDWITVEFVQSGWDTKALVKKMVMSNTYQQQSSMHHVSVKVDPENQWLARANRFRHSAEEVRDMALASSGLLNRTIGGPSVRPFQPANYYSSNSGKQWKQSDGSDALRRGLYTYWQRTAPYAAYIIFDAPSRQICTAQRPRTNTPLQALVTMNDPMFHQAGIELAKQTLSAFQSDAKRLSHIWQRVLSRKPNDQELSILEKLLAEQRRVYSSHELSEKLLGPAANKSDRQRDQNLAAWTNLASIVLNLDEAITRE